ncbi:MAG: hypothetical protein AB7K24_00550, partial [Gemmataceae bacterium]
VDDDDEDDDDDDDDDDRPRRRKPETPLRPREWKNSRIGVLLVYISANLILGAACIVQMTALALFLLGWMGVGLALLSTMVQVSDVTAQALGVCAGVSYLVGLVFCCFAPPRNSAHVLAIVSASLAGGWLLFGLIGVFTTTPVIKILCGILVVGQSIVFLFHLRALALTLKLRDVANACRNLAIASGVSLVGYPLLVYVVIRLTIAAGTAIVLSGAKLSPTALMTGGSIPIVLVIAFGVGLYVSLFMWFMMNLTAIYDGINYEMAKGRRTEVAVWIPLLGGAAFFFVVNFIIALVVVMSH